MHLTPLLRMQVPWGGKETALGMVAWVAAFGGVGLAFIPVLSAVAGPKGFSALSATDKSVFALVNQVGGGCLQVPVMLFYITGDSGYLTTG